MKHFDFRDDIRLRLLITRGLLATGILACVFSLPVRAQKAKPTTSAKDAPVVVQPGAPGKPTKTLPSSTRARLPEPSAADVEFMQGMIMHHAQAVEMTALIESHTSNPELRTLGARISKSQSDEMQFMRRWLESRGKPTSMSTHDKHEASSATHDMHRQASGHMMTDEKLMPGMLTQKQIAALKEARDREFDRLFLSGMIQHHEGALVMVKDLFDTAGAGQDAELFNFASDVDSGQRAEIRAMERMLVGPQGRH